MSKRIKECHVNSPHKIAETLLNEEQRVRRELNHKATETLNKAKMEASALVDNSKREMDAKLSRTEENLSWRIQNVYNAHNNNLKKAVAQMDHSISLLRDETTRKITSVQKDLQGNINSLQQRVNNDIKSIHNKVNQVISDVNAKFSAQQKQINDQSNRLNKQQDQINAIYADIQNTNETASSMVEDLKALTAIVEKRCPHEKYAEAEWQRLCRSMHQEVNVNDPAATIIAAVRRNISELLQYEEIVMEKQIEFEALHNIAITEAFKVTELMAQNRTINTVDENGNPITDESGDKIVLEVDFWTNGEYSNLKNRLDLLLRQLQKEKDNSSLTNEVVIDITMQISEIEANMCILVQRTAQLGFASQYRIQTCEDVVNAMIENGYELKEKNEELEMNFKGGKIDCDQREGVFAVLQNGNGNEVTVMVDSNEENLDTQKITFHRNSDETMSSKEYMDSLNAIKNIIEESGYQLGQLQTPQGFNGDTKYEELADAQALKRAQRRRI